MRELQFGPYRVQTSHEEKIFFPDEGITKGEVVAYYRKIAEFMLPHLKERPLMMHRFPDGIDGEGFYQKEVPDYFPSWIPRVELAKKGGKVTHAVCNNAATLAYLANQACITPHIWLSRRDKPDMPDRMIFDLDPSGDDFGKVREAALHLRDKLKDLGLPSFVMTTGSRGLHVTVPLLRKNDFDKVRETARRIAKKLAENHPDDLTLEQSIEKREGRLFIDTNRNAYAQTAAAPYSVRARPGAPVATPLHWDEVAEGSLGPRAYTIKNIFRRLSAIDPPWKNMTRTLRGLHQAMEILG